MANKAYHHLYGKRWQKLRAHHLAQHPLCALHLTRGEVVAASVVDHVTPHRGDVRLFWNGKLQSLCKRCHDSDKQAEERQPEGPPMVGEDGYPTQGDW